MSPDIRMICINMIWTLWEPMKVSIPSRSLPDYPSSKVSPVMPNVLDLFVNQEDQLEIKQISYIIGTDMKGLCWKTTGRMSVL